jgi:succinate-semialdehyde dehydrogenase/glutarate-semialdehyde dehydrogenase
METLLGDAKSAGARFHLGGARLGTKGYFWEPTVLSDVPNGARIMNEEPFGPVAILNPFSRFDEVIVQANRLP